MDLDFPEPTATANYVLPTLRLDEGPFIFTYLNAFLSYITPHDLPVVNCVLELLRDAFHSRLSIMELLMEALKIESGFICLISLFLVISLIPLGIVAAWSCGRGSKNLTDDCGVGDGVPPVDPLTLDETVGNVIHCRRKVLQFLLQFILLLLICSASTMIITNEEISAAVDKTPDVLRASLKDIEAFLKDSHKQILFSVHEGMNTVSDRLRLDFEEIDKLLGDPIQRDLELSTGIESSLDVMNGICSTNYEIVHRIQILHDSIAKAILISHDAFTRIEELQTQLTVLQRQCVGRDRSLCETLKIKGLDETNIIGKLIKLQTDPSLYKMLTLGELESNGVKRNLSMEIKHARQFFQGFSMRIKVNATKHWNDINNELTAMKDATLASTNALSFSVRAIIDRADKTWTLTLPVLDDINDVSHFLWSLSLITAVIVFIVTLLLLGGLGYGCARSENRARLTFIIAATAISLGCIGLGMFTIFVMLLGGHGEVFLCRPLYESPNYSVLTKLLDRPGLVYGNGTRNGIIADILKPSGSPLNATIFNATLSGALKKCENNQSTFSVFGVEALMNLTDVTELKKYPRLETAIDQLSITAHSFSSYTEHLQSILEFMFVSANIDLAAYRTDLSSPTPERDLSTFIDQVQRVSLQIQDVATSSRMTTLSTRARRLQTAVFQPLEKTKNDIIYHLTALELQRGPWSHQVNQSLLQLKTAQFFLSQKANDVCVAKTRDFKERLKHHIKHNKHHLLSLLNERTASCRPLFDIFNANRMLLCHHTIAPLNGLWFSALLCLTFWNLATPISLALANIYGRMGLSRGLRHTNSHQAPADSLIISEQSNWAASSSQRTPRIDRRAMRHASVRSAKSETSNFVFDE
ncbi:prominin-1-A [Bradysia coprophila]|uniref:prominin-1-A n=1 Tax=Bradysia coprophila TaxID=38358 RepID=UPI00187D7B4A|nr:prominin-1-A [Bradysia coprophila]XP_037024843.1 prominin-1-A [Bradysia coprophila]